MDMMKQVHGKKCYYKRMLRNMTSMKIEKRLQNYCIDDSWNDIFKNER